MHGRRLGAGLGRRRRCDVRWDSLQPAKASLTDATCGADHTFHLENVRIQGAKNTTIRNSWFLKGSDAGSGHIFITTTSPQDTQPTGFRLENTVLEAVNGTYVLQQHSNVQSCATYVLAHNTFFQGFAFSCGITNGMQWIGNLGPWVGCDGTHVKNVFQKASQASCGSDKWVSGPDYSVSALGISADARHLNAGSPALDAAEAAGASQWCGAGALDFEGDARPVGAFCDAGADER